MGTALVFAVLGLVLAIGPFAAPEIFPLPMLAALPASAVLLFIAAILAWLRLYVKTSANLAFVRTGQGGAKPILDGGSVVIPLVHNVIYISLETMKLDVERTGEDALITKDNLRVDVRGEFYIKVDANQDDIVAAARSLGERGTHNDAVSALVFEKLVSALRSVAATMDLVEIHSRREDFAKAVFESVREDLKHNGLTLESVTISRLDQTDPSTLSDDNIFDAQGKKKITEITQAALVERNRLTREAELQRTAKDVETRQEILALERRQAEAEATQATEVAKVRADQLRAQKQFAIEQEQRVQESEIGKEQAVQQAKVNQELQVRASEIQRDKELILQEQAKQQADIQRQQQVETARIAQEQAVEVARREREIAVAEKEAARAAAERAAYEAGVAREKASQEVLTMTATSEADREAQKKLIAAKQEVEQGRIRLQTEAEVAAYARVKEAEAEKLAADKQAEARLQMAQAEAKAKEMQAQGEQAVRMVEVNVEREKVAVEMARVDVERQSLENRETYDKVAVGFEQTKLQIAALRDVQVALAESLGQFMSKGNFQIFGDPTTLSKMTEQFTSGLGFGSLAQGLLSGAPEALKELAGQLGEAARPVVDKLTKGAELPPRQPQAEDEPS